MKHSYHAPKMITMHLFPTDNVKSVTTRARAVLHRLQPHYRDPADRLENRRHKLVPDCGGLDHPSLSRTVGAFTSPELPNDLPSDLVLSDTIWSHVASTPEWPRPSAPHSYPTNSANQKAMIKRYSNYRRNK